MRDVNCIVCSDTGIVSHTFTMCDGKKIAVTADICVCAAGAACMKLIMRGSKLEFSIGYNWHEADGDSR